MALPPLIQTLNHLHTCKADLTTTTTN